VPDITLENEKELYAKHDFWGFIDKYWDRGKKISQEQVERYIPKKAFMNKSKKTFSAFSSIRFFISYTEEFKEKIEELEPGVHQFFPIEIYRKDGSLLERPVYLMNICTQLDSLMVEKSEKLQRITMPPNVVDPELYTIIPNISTIVLNGDIIKGHHIWMEKHISGMNRYFYSDKLVAFVKKQKLHGMEVATKVIVV